MLELLVIKAAYRDVSCCCPCLDVASLDITCTKVLSLLQYLYALHVQDLYCRAEPGHRIYITSPYMT
jgi:hypothetical protein